MRPRWRLQQADWGVSDSCVLKYSHTACKPRALSILAAWEQGATRGVCSQKDPWLSLTGLRDKFAWCLKLLRTRVSQCQSLSRVQLCDPVDHSPLGSSVHRISQARILKWLPFPPPGDLPDPGIEPESLVSPSLAGGFFTTEPPGKPFSSMFPPKS